MALPSAYYPGSAVPEFGEINTDKDAGKTFTNIAPTDYIIPGAYLNQLAAEVRAVESTALGAWGTYTPTIVYVGSTNCSTSSVDAHYKTIGKTSFIRITFVVTCDAPGTYITVSVPEAIGVNQCAPSINLTTGKTLSAFLSPNGKFYVYLYDASAPAASGDTIVITGTFEIS